MKEPNNEVYGVDLVAWDEVPKADCVIVAVGHNEICSMSMMQLKTLLKDEIPDEEKVLIDIRAFTEWTRWRHLA